MDDIQLKQRLRSVGMTCFVNYFHLFSDFSLSHERVAEILIEREGWEKASTRHRRVRGAHSIIEAGRAKDALTLVADSQMLPASVTSRARSLLKTL